MNKGFNNKRRYLTASVAALLLGMVTSQDSLISNQATQNFTVAAKFQLDTGMFFYDKLDTKGHILERIQKFYPMPPDAVCNGTTYGDFL